MKSQHVRLTDNATKVFSNPKLGNEIIKAISKNGDKLINGESIRVGNIIITSATNQK